MSSETTKHTPPEPTKHAPPEPTKHAPSKSPPLRVKFLEPVALCIPCNHSDSSDTACVSSDTDPDPDTPFGAYKLAMKTKHKEVCDCGKMDNSCPRGGGGVVIPTPTSAAQLIEEEEEVLNLGHMMESIRLRGAPWDKNTPITVCNNCLKTSKVSKCGQCGNVAYCGKECQKADWSEHKGKCKGRPLHETTITLKERFATIFDYLNRSLSIGRDPFTHAISWAVPCMETINYITEFCYKNGLSTILEIGAGHGLWSLLLQMTGLTIHTTDPCVSHGLKNTGTDGFFTTIDRLSNTEAIEKYIIDEKDPEKVPKVLFLCWPGHNEPFAAETIEMFATAAAKIPGDKYLIYIGEPRGGCTADDRFFDILRSCDHLNFDVPRWPGIYDSGKIFRLKR